MIKVKALNSHDDSWMDVYVNMDLVQYIQPIKGGGAFKEHILVGFSQREYIVHHDNLKDLFDIYAK